MQLNLINVEILLAQLAVILGLLPISFLPYDYGSMANPFFILSTICLIIYFIRCGIVWSSIFSIIAILIFQLLSLFFGSDSYSSVIALLLIIFSFYYWYENGFFLKDKLKSIFYFVIVIHAASWLLQIVYIYITSYIEPIINILEVFFSTKWKSDTHLVHWFYQDGSYVATNMRINGLFQEASINTFFISLIVIPLCVQSLFSEDYEIKYKLLFYFCMVTLILTKSSSAIIGFIGIVTYYTLKKKSYSSYFLAALLISIAFLLFGDIFDFYLSKIFDSSHGSTGTRLAYMQTMLNAIYDRPIFGLGKGIIFSEYYNYLPSSAINIPEVEWNFKNNVFSASSAYLLIAVDYGLLIFLILMLFIIYKFFKVSVESAKFAIFLIIIMSASNLPYYFPFVVFSFGYFLSLDRKSEVISEKTIDTSA
ncbi:O-antigen ligase family protein [Vibrio cholerae]|nr:O-antigen ligase family protein [Vibrio cholerae]